MDGYLIDGVSLLYKYGVALMQMYKRNIKGMVYKTGEEFWTFLLTLKSKKGNERLDFSLLTELAHSRTHRHGL